MHENAPHKDRADNKSQNLSGREDKEDREGPGNLVHPGVERQKHQTNEADNEADGANKFMHERFGIRYTSEEREYRMHRLTGALSALSSALADAQYGSPVESEPYAHMAELLKEEASRLYEDAINIALEGSTNGG